MCTGLARLDGLDHNGGLSNCLGCFMNRADFQALAKLHLRNGEALLEAQLPDAPIWAGTLARNRRLGYAK